MTVALIVAAGRGRRFGGPIPKQYRLINDVPVIRYTASAFLRHPQVTAVQAVIHPADRELYDEATEGLGLLPPLIGGASRQESVRFGLEGIGDQLNGAAPEKVIIHDAVRPFVEQETITGVIEALDRTPAALAGVPVTDTLKRCEDGIVGATVERTNLWRAQTPQGFRYKDILDAHRQAYLDNPLGLELTDDAMVAERAGLTIGMVLGTEDNFKITTEEDLIRAEIILQRGHRVTHTGWGFDTQPFRPTDHLMVCGIPVRLEQKLGTLHDADVPLAAVTRALLGTVGGPQPDGPFRADISNKRIVNAETRVREAVSVLAMAGGRIDHIDLTLICDHPDIMLYSNDMIQRTATLLSVSPDHVSIKYVDMDDMGFVLRRDGLSAQCIATVNYPAGLPD